MKLAWGPVAISILCMSMIPLSSPAILAAASPESHRVGLQLYSLRDQFAKDVPATLDKVKAMGITICELYGTFNLTPEKFRAELDKRGLKAVSSHFPYERFRDDLDGVIRDAKTLGLEYAGCAWIPHEQGFDEKLCREAISVFKKADDAMTAQKLRFFYHVHGYEFQPYQKGTLFDLMMTEINPGFMHYEMDVFWIVHAGQDPEKMLRQYGTRWQLMHLKGMKDSTPTGKPTGETDVSNNVPLGGGKIDYAKILPTAKAVGVQQYFIEDESPLAEQQIPQSLRFLETVIW